MRDAHINFDRKVSFSISYRAALSIRFINSLYCLVNVLPLLVIDINPLSLYIIRFPLTHQNGSSSNRRTILNYVVCGYVLQRHYASCYLLWRKVSHNRVGVYVFFLASISISLITPPDIA